MNCYSWAETLVIAPDRLGAKIELERAGLNPNRFELKLLGGEDFILDLYSTDTLEPAPITVRDYAAKYTRRVIEAEDY